MVSMAGASLFLPFLPLLPKQILLNNFLSDVPSMTIATDRVDREQVDHPRRWDIRFIRNFMLVFGLVSSVFDYVTFGALLYWLRATEPEFQTGWFVESLMTQTLIIHVIRTKKIPFIQGRASWPLTVTTAIIMSVGMWLPYSPLAAAFRLHPAATALLATTFPHAALLRGAHANRKDVADTQDMVVNGATASSAMP
jgi:P-type Mg2+ transporter